MRPILAVLFLFLLAGIGYALVLTTVVWGVSERPDERAGKRRFLIVLGFAVGYRLILFASSPIQEIDYYRYIWDGRSLAGGINPFAFAPAEIDRASSAPGKSLGGSRLSIGAPAVCETPH